MISALVESPAFPKAGDKLPPQTFGPFDMPRLARYADVSGDTNPIHLDAALAQQAGLAAPPVQGMLLMSAFEPALAAWQPHLVLQRLSAKFLRPVLAGESIVVSGRVGNVAGEPRDAAPDGAQCAGRDCRSRRGRAYRGKRRLTCARRATSSSPAPQAASGERWPWPMRRRACTSRFSAAARRASRKSRRRRRRRALPSPPRRSMSATARR